MGAIFIRFRKSVRPIKRIDTHEDNRHNGEYDDSSTLPHRLLCLLGRLPRLEDRTLLLLEIEKVIQLCMIGSADALFHCCLNNFAAGQRYSLIDLHLSRCSLRFSSGPLARQSGSRHLPTTRRPSEQTRNSHGAFHSRHLSYLLRSNR